MRLLQKQLIAFVTVMILILSNLAPFVGQAASENITVQQAIDNNQGNATVEGYIVGYTAATKSYRFDAPFAGDTNLAIADHANEKDPAKILPVQLPTDFRGKFGLKTNPLIIGKKVIITGSLEAYFSVPGLKNPTLMKFADDTPEGDVENPFEGIEGLRIHDIQGESHVSPYENQNVKNVEGVVTKVVDSRNVFIQDLQPDDNPKTSEGILVYKPAHNVSVGDLIAVDGTVKEWVLDGYADKLTTDLTMTEINAQYGNIKVLKSNQPLPEPIIIGKDGYPPSDIIDNDQFAIFDPEEDAIDFYESLEGMRIALDSPLVVGPQNYGEVPVIAEMLPNKVYSKQGGILLTAENENPERMHLLFDDRSFIAKTGDQFNGLVTGVLSYSFSNYKVLVDKDTMPALKEREITKAVTSLGSEKEKLTIASYNIENYSAKTSKAKTQKIAQSVITNLNTPDIIGLVEVQDNNGQTDDGTTDASESYEALINEIVALGGPVYKWTDIAPEDKADGGAPGGNIRVGFLFNPERVSLSEAPKGSATESVNYKNGSLTVNPGRIDPLNPIFESTRKALAAQFEFNGENVIVIANHFNSKLGDEPSFGRNQPVQLGSVAKRVEIAKVINGFVANVHKENPLANVVVLGDLNDFEFSQSLQALKGDQLTNMIETLPAEERFTYIYQGNSQVLDHILVSNHLAENALANIININSLYMEEHGRASDHDPVMVELDLGRSLEGVEVNDDGCPKPDNNGKKKGHEKEQNDNGKHKGHDKNGKACGYNGAA
ncbi:endonuclease [Bacillus sp. FJAT-29790]|uniref:DUF6359 domain-containing protein n=1 Tax=Bacillus sp. FJAT-29790 TaxID=1895002 RepID=UPI001C21B302|nr:DUF6359 domain-containing protein [Bacillus sp. FJAT-29790]MBU8879612.1 endonuclease [Bacillus sp. FJAT-29790]